MSYNAQQLEGGPLKNHLTQGEKKANKKAHARKQRRKAKNINNPNPQHNRFKGGTAV